MTNIDDVIPVAFATDHNYVMPTCVALRSLIDNTVHRLKVIIICHPNVNEDDRKFLSSHEVKGQVEVNLVTGGGSASYAYEIRGITVPAYYRLQIPWLFPEIDKIVYCDGDVVFNGDIADLYKQDTHQKLLGGVHTPFYDTFHFKKYCTTLGIKSEEYVNSGVIIMNLKKFRDKKLNEIFDSQIQKPYRFQDQDILNIYCNGDIEYLDIKYNMPSYIEDNTLPEPMIIHYSGPKPWKRFTLRWHYWWYWYSKSAVYNPDFELEKSLEVLIPSASLMKCIRMFVRHMRKNFRKFGG